MHRNLILFTAITISFLPSCEEGFDFKSGVTLSEKNELYSLELNLSNNVTEDLSPVNFNARVIRHSEFQIRPDSKIIGYWKLDSFTIDSLVQNVAQFPTYYQFYPEQYYDKIEESTVGADPKYDNGGWVADLSLGTLDLSMLGETTNINLTFDTNLPIVPLDGFMIWEYEKDGKSYKKVLRKYETTDPEQFNEPPSYLTIAASGGTIEGITEPYDYDILIQLPNRVNSTYEVSGSFIPGYDFYSGQVLATLFSDRYTIINVNIPINIVTTIY